MKVHSDFITNPFYHHHPYSFSIIIIIITQEIQFLVSSGQYYGCIIFFPGLTILPNPRLTFDHQLQVTKNEASNHLSLRYLPIPTTPNLSPQQPSTTSNKKQRTFCYHLRRQNFDGLTQPSQVTSRRHNRCTKQTPEARSRPTSTLPGPKYRFHTFNQAVREPNRSRRPSRRPRGRRSPEPQKHFTEAVTPDTHRIHSDPRSAYQTKHGRRTSTVLHLQNRAVAHRSTALPQIRRMAAPPLAFSIAIAAPIRPIHAAMRAITPWRPP